MKTMKVPRGTARQQRRIGLDRGWKFATGDVVEMRPPSAKATAQALADQVAMMRKVGIALFMKHGGARVAL